MYRLIWMCSKCAETEFAVHVENTRTCIHCGNTEMVVRQPELAILDEDGD